MPTEILGTTLGSLGALLVGIGASLLLIDAVATPRLSSWSETYGEPGPRLAVSCKVVGAVFATVGAGLLLYESSDLSVVVIVIADVLALALVFGFAAHELRKHHLAMREPEERDLVPSWWWCLVHPGWREPDGE
jgi:hypothetical protein